MTCAMGNHEKWVRSRSTLGFLDSVPTTYVEGAFIKLEVFLWLDLGLAQSFTEPMCKEYGTNEY